MDLQQEIPDIPAVVTLKTLLNHYTEEITDENDEYEDYYDFVQGTSPEQKQQCYGAMINFFSLDVRTFLNETEICRKLRMLFVHPTEVLGGKMINNQIICSYVLLDFTLFCMRWVHDVFTSELTADEKKTKIDVLKTGLDNYDSQYSFTSSTISQLFYYTKDPSSPKGEIKKYEQVSKVLSKCISIQIILEQVGIKRQLYTFACNRIVSLYIERIRNPKLKLTTYTSDFDRDDEPWNLHVMLKLEPGIRMATMSRIHASNKRMAPLLNLISLKRPAWKGGYANTRRDPSTKRRRHTTRRRTKHRRRH